MSKSKRGPGKPPQGWWERHKGKVKTGLATIAALAALADGADNVWDDLRGEDSSIVCSTELRNYGDLKKDFPDAEIPVPDDVEDECDISDFLGEPDDDDAEPDDTAPEDRGPAPEPSEGTPSS